MIGVVKIGGAIGNALEPLMEELASRTTTEHWVLVHGASGVTDELCRVCNVEPRYVTSPSGYRSRYVGEVERAIFEAASYSFSAHCATLLAMKDTPAVPLRPDVAGTAFAKRKESLRVVSEGRQMILRGNYSGTVTRVDPKVVLKLLGKGCIPILPPLAMDEAGGVPLDVDGDRLGAAVAGALGSQVLVILSNVPGLLRDPSDPNSLIAEATSGDWDELEFCAKGNMKRKLLACKEALDAGVPHVILADSRLSRPLSAALSGGGTHIWRTRPSMTQTG